MRSRQMFAFAALFGAVSFLAFLFARPALADEPLVGTWKLVSAYFDDLETKERNQNWGQHPTGYMVFTPELHYVILFTAEGRAGNSTQEERAKAYATMVASAGTYRVEDGKYSFQTEVSWNPGRASNKGQNEFKIEGNRLTITTAGVPGAALSGHTVRSNYVLERVTQ